MEIGKRGLSRVRTCFPVFARSSSGRGRRFVLTGLALSLLVFFGAPAVIAHSPVIDAELTDWCVGAVSNTAFAIGTNRIEDRAVALSCGNCSVTTDVACVVNADCPAAETCVNLGSRTEVGWWDDRTDGAVNDLATFVTTQDDEFLYFAAELWVDPDPVSLPYAQVAIDYAQGGLNTWHDPQGQCEFAPNVGCIFASQCAAFGGGGCLKPGRMRTPGRCSVDTDRACTENADCHFCPVSLEPTGACSVTTTQACRRGVDTDCPGVEVCIERNRTCGSGCDILNPLDVCDTSQVCVGAGDGGLVDKIAANASPTGGAEYIIAFDFGIWLGGFDLQNGVLVLEPGQNLIDFPFWPGPWAPVNTCTNDSPDDPTTRCDFVPTVDPGASGASSGPPGAVEAAIPWCAFGCTNCPEFAATPGLDQCGAPTNNSGCSCPGFGPGQDFRYTVIVARDVSDFNFRASGGLEDAFTEPVAQVSTATTQDCGGIGADTTDCEIADNSLDAMLLNSTVLPHEVPAGGRATLLTVAKNGGSLDLDWFPSCSTADTEYGVYEGVIGGTFNSHTQLACSVGGTATTVPPGAGNRYYLVVPSDGANEGSYGLDSSNGERAVGIAPCAPQALGTCP